MQQAPQAHAGCITAADLKAEGHPDVMHGSLPARSDWFHNVQVTDEILDAYFEPLAAGEELQLDDVARGPRDVSGSPLSKL